MTRRFSRPIFLSQYFCSVLAAVLFSVSLHAAPRPKASANISQFQRSTIPVSAKRHHAFRVPIKLRPRVEFWVDVFSKYSEHHAVIHHRLHPNIIFEVLDLSSKAETLSPGRYAKERKRIINKTMASIKTGLNRLASGNPPRSNLEKNIARQMSYLGSGTKKYRDVVKQGWIRSQRGIRERYRHAVERSGRYMHILETVFVKEFGLPVELTRLPFVESSFDYKAYSSVGAAGIWQFMPATGRAYKLKVTKVVDERRDVTAASKAAAKYLTHAYKTLGTWPLSLTSYNHGVTGVLRKVKKVGTRDLAKMVEMTHNQPFGFASQNFYPEFLAALEIYENPQRYFPGVRVEPPVEIARRKLSRGTSAAALSKQLGISKEALRSVNYALHDRVWSGRYSIPAGYTVNVPSNYKQQLAHLKQPKHVESASSGSSVYGGATYKVRRGDTLGRIAKRYGTRVSTIKQLNGLRSDMVRVGQVLTVKAKSSGASSSRASVSTSSGRTYVVRAGDSLFAIARAHRTTVQSIQSTNGLKSARIRVGQKLKLPVGASGTRSPSSKPQSTPTIHRVQRGDTLWKISQRYRISVAELRRRNKLRSNKIKPGQKLVVSG